MTAILLWLFASVIRLAEGTYAVSAAYPRSGDVFIVANGRVRWSIKDVGRVLNPSHIRDEIARWRRVEFGWGDGPLVGTVKALPPARNGHPRFYVDAYATPMAGGTWANQISIWEWNGRKAVPLLVRSYSVSFETGQPKLAGDTLTIPAKGAYKSFSTCGACSEPEVTWTLRVTPDGVRDLGRVPKVPELQFVDDLLDRVLHHRSTRDIAAPGVAEALRGMLPEPLGMLGRWEVSTHGSRRVLDFSTDELEGGSLRFEMEERPQGLYVLRVTSLRAHKVRGVSFEISAP